MYSKIKLRVKQTSKKRQELGNDLDDCFFASKAGVFQGESLSPFLFSMFLNDVNDALKTENDVGINLFEWILTILLFADDMALVSESKRGLQKGLDCLSRYCDKWGLEVNKDKTKCVAFKKGGKIGIHDKWTYKNQPLETVNQFKYLGFLFGSSGKFAKGIQCLAEQGNRALFSLKQIIHNHSEMMPSTQLTLFNAMIIPIISYGCELWGFCEADPLERLHLGFLKSILCVRKSTPSCSVYEELNTTTLKCIRLKRILKFWLKIINLPNENPVKIVYNLLLKDSQGNNVVNWASLVRDLLTTRGFGDVWLSQSVHNDIHFLLKFNQRISDVFLQQNNEQLHNLSEHRLYKHLVEDNDKLGMSTYLSEIKERYLRIAITKFKLGSHSFMIERGKWLKPKLDFLERVCETCLAVEDEFHILIECKRFDALRKKYIPEKLTERPSMHKFVQFINYAKGNELRNLSIFCHKILIIYRDTILLQ